MIFGLILIIVGILVLLQQFGVITGDIWPVFWGVLLIAVGFAIALKHRARAGWSCCGFSKKSEPKNNH